LAKEIESGKTTSLDTKANEQNRYWFNIPGKICDSLSNMFRQTSLMLGAEPTAAELFEKAAKYAEKLKLDLEKERGKAINPAAIKHSRKSAVDLINRGENTSKTRTL